MTQEHEFSPDWASPPGDTIQDLLDEKGLTCSELVAKLGLKVDCDRLLLGQERMTPGLAAKLGGVLGGSTAFWLARDEQYMRALRRLAENVPVQEADSWLKSLPTADLARWGFISRTRTRATRLEDCLQFFGAGSLGQWQRRTEEYLAGVTFRRSGAFVAERSAVATWLRVGELKASANRCQSWDPEAFKSVLPEARSLSRRRDPSKFVPELQRLCESAGVALVLAPTPQGCPASGATRFMSRSKALMLLSFRYRSDDHFWFTFFHEAGHLLLHGANDVFLETLATPTHQSRQEQEANDFAAEMLIPTSERSEMAGLTRNTKDIMRFARRLGVSAGIVVGQMQHGGSLQRDQMNHLKVYFKWE